METVEPLTRVGTLERWHAVNLQAPSAQVAATGFVTALNTDVFKPAARYRGLSRIIPYGSDAADEAFTITVYGAHDVDDGRGGYIIMEIATLTCTLGTKAGVDGALIDNSDLFCDTITKTDGAHLGVSANLYGDLGVRIESPGSNGLAVAAIPDLGNIPWVGLDFDASTAAGCNALVAFGT